MPFAVIETVNDETETELSIVPDKWLRSSKNGSIVLWPNTTSATERQAYFRDENMCPQKTWFKWKCTVKRYPIATYEAAVTALKAISGVAEKISPVKSQSEKRERDDQETNSSQKTMAVEKSLSSQIEHQNGADKGKIHVNSPANNTIETKPNEVPLASTKEESGSLPVIISAYSEANSENIAFVVKDASQADPEPSHLSGTDHFMLKCLDKMNEILGLQHLITARLDQLEEKVTDLSTQNRTLLNVVRNSSRRSSHPLHYSSHIEETLSFNFHPLENAQQLEDLERKLEDEEYRSKLLRWLRLNSTGNCPEDRMMGVLDALFTKKFQTLCSWTGVSRKGPKTAVMPNRNILELFQIIGSGESDEVTKGQLADFLMMKLRNSLKRLQSAGLRRGTRKIRRRKIQLQQLQPSAPCDNTDESSSRYEPEPEAYSQFIEDSGSSDVEVQQHSAVFTGGEGHILPPTSDNSYNTFSIVKIE